MTRKNSTQFSTQMGEGKIGLILILLVIAILVALGIKIGPVYYSNNKFIEAAELASDGASKWGGDAEKIEAEIRARAKEFNIVEAQTAGAIRVSSVPSDKGGGTVTVRIAYKREINIYGVTKLTLTTNKEMVKPYISL